MKKLSILLLIITIILSLGACSKPSNSDNYTTSMEKQLKAEREVISRKSKKDLSNLITQTYSEN